MDLRFSANIVQFLRLFPYCKRSRAFHASAKAAIGTAMACLLGAVFSVGLAAGQSLTHRPGVDRFLLETARRQRRARWTECMPWTAALVLSVVAVATVPSMGLADDRPLGPVAKETLVELDCPSPVPKGAFEVDIEFYHYIRGTTGETERAPSPVTGFVAEDIVVRGGTVSKFSGSGASYKAWITQTWSTTPRSGEKYVDIEVPPGVATDSTGRAAGGDTCFFLYGQPAAVTIEDVWASEGDAISFTVTLDGAVVGGLTVTPSFTDGTATEGTDYTENTAALTFTGTAGETKSFTVATIEDTDEEGNEAFFVGMTVSGTSATVEVGPTAKGTIINDDGTPTLTVADALASEGDAISFTVTLDGAVVGGLTVTPSFTDGTATEGTDYTENTAALTFTGTAGETKSFTVATTEDAAMEEDETFTVGLTVSGTTETVRATDTATGTIVDDERLPAVTIDDSNSGEGGVMTFSVTLDKAVSGGLTVTPSFTDGTATKGTDYTENTAALTFAGTHGETQTFTVPLIEDTEPELEETFTVSLAVSGTTETVTATDTATGTISDNDTGVIVSAVTVADESAAEGEALTFTVTLNAGVSGGLTVTPSFTDGTATKGTDYTENTAALTFAGTHGETKSFTVATTEDAVVEEDETFTVNLAVSGTSAAVTATDTATGTITNDDGAPGGGTPTVTIANASAAEGDALTFTVTLNLAVQDGLTVTPSFTDGTATEGTDYTENTAALIFTGTTGETKSFTVATTEDAVVEEDETFTVSLTMSNAPASVTAGDPATGTITNDDDANAPPAITPPGDKTYTQGETITAFSFTVTDADDDPVTVRMTGLPSGLSLPTPEVVLNPGGNINPLRVQGTVSASATAQAYTVTISADDGVNAVVTETFTITVTASSPPNTPPAVTLADASASEGDAITFTVTLTKAVLGGLTVTPSFTDGTAIKGTDYTENTAALTFAGTAGETKSFTVATTEDAVVEEDETFTVGLSVSNTTVTATGTILDDDINVNDPGDDPGSNPGNEPGNNPPRAIGEMPKQILLVGTSATVNSEPYFVDPDGDPLDYEATAIDLDIATAVTSSPPVTTTAKTRGTTTVVVRACDPHGACAEQDFEVLVIQASISFIPDSLTVPEGDVKSYTVALQAEPAGPVTVTLTSEDPGAATVSPTELTFTPGNWNTRQRVHVTGVHDDDTDNELVTVTHATSGGGYHVTADFMVTVLDDDTPGVTITPTAVEVDEGATAARAYTVVLDTKPKGAVTVTPVSGDVGTVTVSSQTLTFTPATWNRPQAVGLTGVQDPDATDETVAVHHEVSGADYAGVTADSVRVRVLDKEGAVRRRRAEHWLARFGRTVATDVVDVVGDRFAAPPGESHVTVNGRRLDPKAGGPSGDEEQGVVAVLWTILGVLGVTGPQSEQGAPGVGLPLGRWAGPDIDIGGRAWPSRDGSLRLPSGREVLTNSAFQLSLNGDRPGDSENWTLWGLGRVTRFQARPEDGLSLDGEVVSGHLGADYRWSPRSLTGVVVSHAMGRGDFDVDPTKDASVIMDNIKSSLTSVHPYVRWTPSEGLDLWSILGVGLGKMELDDSIGRVETDIAMRMASLGVRNALVSVGRFDLALKADAFVVEMESDDAPALRSMYRDVERLRLMLEGQTEWTASADSRLVPSMELGMRYDGGDAETGVGAELGGGLAYVHTTLGLTVEARGRILLVHRENDFKQWGASVMVNLDPGASGEGLSFSLAPVWGDAPSGTGALWGNEQVGVAPQLGEAPGWQPDRMDVAVGYGLRLRNGRRVLTPFGELSLGGAGSLQMGLRLEETVGAPGGLRLELFGGQRNLQDATPDYHIGLSGTFEF